MSHGPRAMNLLVGCLLTAAMPGVAFAGTPAATTAPPPAAAPYEPPPPSERLTLLNVELADLTARRDAISLQGPVFFIIGGVMVGSAGIALATSGCGHDDPYNENACLGRTQLAGIVMFFAGTASVMAGTIVAIVRASKRRHLNRKILQRQDEANALRGLQPQWGVAPTRGGGGALSLSLAF